MSKPASDRVAVIDFQAYIDVVNGRRDFIIKELSIVDVKQSTSQHWFFKPPHQNDQLSENLWAMQNLHGISWDDGEIEYDKLMITITTATEQYDYLYAKGLEKCIFLEDILKRPVYDLHNFSCPSLKKLRDTAIKCRYHRNGSWNKYVCSLNQAHNLALWMETNPKNVDLSIESVRRNTFNNKTINMKPEHMLLAFNGFIRGWKTTANCYFCNLKFKTLSTCAISPYSYHKTNNPQCQWFLDN